MTKSKQESPRVGNYILGWLLLPIFLLVATWEHGSKWAEDVWFVMRDTVRGEIV